MLMDPVRKYCQLRTVPDDFNPQDMVLSSFSMAGNRQVLNPEMAREVRLMQVTKGKLSLAKRKQLLKSIQDLCQGLPIHVIEEIDVTNEEYEAGFMTLNSTNVSHRVKRSCWITCDDTSDRFES